MEEFITPSNITFVIGLIGIIFTIYNYFRDPQIKGERVDALIDQRIGFIQESNDRRFGDVHKEIEAVNKLNQNCIHTIETKVDTLTSSVNDSKVEIGKLATIIDERIPKRQ